MDYIEHTTSMSNSWILNLTERSQRLILNIGYRFVAYRNKLKKSIRLRYHLLKSLHL